MTRRRARSRARRAGGAGPAGDDRGARCGGTAERRRCPDHRTRAARERLRGGDLARRSAAARACAPAVRAGRAVERPRADVRARRCGRRKRSRAGLRPGVHAAAACGCAAACPAGARGRARIAPACAGSRDGAAACRSATSRAALPGDRRRSQSTTPRAQKPARAVGREQDASASNGDPPAPERRKLTARQTSARLVEALASVDRRVERQGVALRRHAGRAGLAHHFGLRALVALRAGQVRRSRRPPRRWMSARPDPAHRGRPHPAIWRGPAAGGVRPRARRWGARAAAGRPRGRPRSLAPSRPSWWPRAAGKSRRMRRWFRGRRPGALGRDQRAGRGPAARSLLPASLLFGLGPARALLSLPRAASRSIRGYGGVDRTAARSSSCALAASDGVQTAATAAAAEPSLDGRQVLPGAAARRRGAATWLHDRARPQVERTIDGCSGAATAIADLAPLAMIELVTSADRFAATAALDGWIALDHRARRVQAPAPQQLERRIFDGAVPDDPLRVGSRARARPRCAADRRACAATSTAWTRQGVDLPAARRLRLRSRDRRMHRREHGRGTDPVDAAGGASSRAHRGDPELADALDEAGGMR